MIQFQHTAISYGKKNVLSDVSFTAKDGQITVLLGKNGAGKSTLLKAAAGLQKFQGNIILDGKDLRSYKARDRAKSVSYMPQVLPLTEMTVRELVMCGRSPYQTIFAGSVAPNDPAVEEVLKKMELENLSEESVAAISGGERQRAYFGMLAAQNAHTVLLDEPTANLDIEHRRMVYDFLYELRQNGKSVVVVMHHIREACLFADNICVIQDGKSIFEGATETFLKSDYYQRLHQISESAFRKWKNNGKLREKNAENL